MLAPGRTFLADNNSAAFWDSVHTSALGDTHTHRVCAEACESHLWQLCGPAPVEREGKTQE